MSIRHCKNATTTSQKRHCTHESVETVASTPTVAGENNANLAAFATVAEDDTPIVYFGFDHIPVGTAQYDLNATP